MNPGETKPYSQGLKDYAIYSVREKHQQTH